MAATTAEAITQPQPVSTHKWAIATAVMLGAFLQRVDTSIVNVALPYMQESFATGVEQISWVVTSYLVALSIMIPLSGWASARFGRRRFLIGSILLFVAASAMCGLARGIGQMVVFRLIQGFAGKFISPALIGAGCGISICALAFLLGAIDCEVMALVRCCL